MQIFYNQDSDCSNALGRIANVQRTYHAIEFIRIALPNSNNRFRQNPSPGAVTVLTTQQQNQRPNQAPYIIHWNANQNLIYYIMNWNEHLPFRYGWNLEFNVMLSMLTHP